MGKYFLAVAILVVAFFGASGNDVLPNRICLEYDCANRYLIWFEKEQYYCETRTGGGGMGCVSQPEHSCQINSSTRKCNGFQWPLGFPDCIAEIPQCP